MSKQVYVFLGPPGSGKGSLSSLCVDQLGWAQISAGNLCRQAVAQGSVAGQQIDFYLKSGILVPDGLVIKLVEQSLRQHLISLNAVILDGFPRTVPQAHELEKLLQGDHFSEVQLVVIKLQVSDEVVVARLVGRLICPNGNCQAVYSTVNAALAARNALECDRCSSALIKRADDEDSVVRMRLASYYEHERPLVDFLKRTGYAVHEIGTERPLIEVFDQVRSLVGVRV